MLKRLVNEARFTLALETTGPVLVKSGHASIDGPDMAPVRTFLNGDWQVYLPGSSLKGVVRSHLEKVARTLNSRQGVVCNPFLLLRDLEVRPASSTLHCDGYPDVSCGDKFQTRKDGRRNVGGTRWQVRQADLDTAVVYADSCPACRLFGSTSFIGRVSIGDAYLTESGVVQREFRDGVGIDRLTGGAAHGAKFDLEVVPSGVRFAAEVILRNFECWQLGALLLVVQDLRDGLIRIGSGRSRGLGAVRGWIEAEADPGGRAGPRGLDIHYLGLTEAPPGDLVVGLGNFLADGSYGTRPDDALAGPKEAEVRRQGVRLVTTYTGSALDKLSQLAVADFVQRVRDWPVPSAMTWESLRWQPARGGST